MVKQSSTIDSAIITPVLLDVNCLIIRTINETEHNKNPIKGIHDFALICLLSLYPVKFTLANMSKKPTHINHTYINA